MRFATLAMIALGLFGSMGLMVLFIELSLPPIPFGFICLAFALVCWLLPLKWESNPRNQKKEAKP